MTTEYIKGEDRLKRILQYLQSTKRIKTQKDFAKEVKCTPSQISKALKGREKDMTPNLMQKVYLAYSDIFNVEYVVNGIGPMVKNEIETNHTDEDNPQTDVQEETHIGKYNWKGIIQNYQETIRRKEELIKEKDDKIESLHAKVETLLKTNNELELKIKDLECVIQSYRQVDIKPFSADEPKTKAQL